MTRVARHVLVGGFVQGVAFRYTTRAKATSLGISGWVRNLPDGRVEAHVEGEAAAVEAMLVFLQEGPPAARVTKIDEREVEPEGMRQFHVTR